MIEVALQLVVLCTTVVWREPTEIFTQEYFVSLQEHLHYIYK